MRVKICLHGLEIKHQNQLLGLVRNLLPDCLSKYKVKDKYFDDDDTYKYREARFKPKSIAGLAVSCAYGSMTVNDKTLPIADVIIDFDTDNGTAVESAQKIVMALLNGKNNFILAEPDFALRVAMLRGRLRLNEYNAYSEENAGCLIYTHLPWQIYEINRLWLEVLTRVEDKPLIRQLRVKIRRLRSVISLLSPLFDAEQLDAWQKLWKKSFDGLASVRELDVALLDCERITKVESGKEEKGVPLLEKILEEKKNKAVSAYLSNLKLNNLTKEYADFLFWLYTTNLDSEIANSGLMEFLALRFTKWSNKLLELTEKYPDTTDIVSLHKIRIKLKRFRYALQSVPEMKRSTELFRALKNLQDSLGLLHDDFVGEELLEGILAEYPGNKELHYEIALFRGWDKGKASSTLENFPIMWDNFCSLLRNWQENNL